jgi:hypothetical protein
VTAQALRRFTLPIAPDAATYVLCALTAAGAGMRLSVLCVCMSVCLYVLLNVHVDGDGWVHYGWGGGAPGPALPAGDLVGAHLPTTQFALRRADTLHKPFLGAQQPTTAEDGAAAASFYPAVAETMAAGGGLRRLSLASRDSSTHSLDDDGNDAEDASTLDVTMLSSLEMGNRVLNDPALASDPQKQLRLSAMTVQQGPGTVPAGTGGPLTATSAAMGTQQFGSLSRKTAPEVNAPRTRRSVRVCVSLCVCVCMYM